MDQPVIDMMRDQEMMDRLKYVTADLQKAADFISWDKLDTSIEVLKDILIDASDAFQLATELTKRIKTVVG